MTHGEAARRWRMYGFFGGMMLFLASCFGGPGGDACGGVDTLVACLSITSIQPTQSGTTTSDVDVTFTPDCDGDPSTIDAEPFTRHDATITFSNTTFPTADAGLSVTLRSFSVSYSLITCPTGAICPPLTGFTEGVNFTVLEDASTSGDFSLVPISVKNEFTTQGGTASAFPVYSANYTFTGTTDLFEDSLTVRGSTSFVMGDFNNCT